MKAPPPLWHPSARLFRVSRGTNPIGYFILDLYRRPGKAPQTSAGALLRGHRGRLPIVLVRGSFDPPTQGTPATLTFDQVRSVFHELGHAVQRLSGKDAKYIRWSGVFTQLDAQEVASQLLEGMRFDYAVMARVARDKAGNPIPRELHARLCKASRFGMGLRYASQMHLSAFSLEVFGKTATTLTPSALMASLNDAFRPTPFYDCHTAGRFWHLGSMGPSYVTYAWSMGLVKEVEVKLLTQGWRSGAGVPFFEKVLRPSGSRDVQGMLTAFLGHAPHPGKTFAKYINSLSRP